MTQDDIAALLARIRFCQVAPHFGQYYLGDGWAVHRHTGIDTSPPHDHPHDLHIYVLPDSHLPTGEQGKSGGYTEEVFEQRNGTWSSKLVERAVGDFFSFKADHIHRIVRLEKAECWTLVRFGSVEVPWRHWPEALQGSVAV